LKSSFQICLHFIADQHQVFIRPKINLSNLSSSEKDLDCRVLYEPYVFKISLIVVYCMVLLVGLTGNALIITLVYKRKDLRKTINQLIANMAFSDFVFQLTFIPVELAKAGYGQWPIAEPAGSIVCKIQTFVVYASVCVSIQSLTWIALDRFIAVVFPMKVYLISSRFRVLAIASMWIVAVLCGSASSIDSKLVHKNGALDCTEKTTPISQYVGAACSFASLISITILYCTIAVTLRRKNKALPTSAVNGNVQRKRQAMKMSICVVAAFYLCFPYVFKVSLIVVYCMVLLVGLTGNALIITLVYKRKDLRKTINQLIANMALSDFVFQLTFIPVELAKAAYGQWPIAEPVGSIVCKIQSFVMYASVYVSVQSLTWIALDRFIAVVFPMKVHLISSRFRVLAISSTWIVA
ncbi:unnamed protein product, partial [Porites evermanni]